MEHEVPNSGVALVVGVTGMAGLSLAEALKSPKAIGGPWKVYGAARRAKPIWFPSSIILDGFIEFDATCVEDTRRQLSIVACEITHVFWMAIQIRDTEEDNVAVNSVMLENVLSVLKSGVGSSLSHITLQTGTKHYMGPVFDPTLSANLVPHHPPYREDMVRLPYPNFYYALEDLVASHTPSITYSIHRPSVIIGASARSVYNVLLSLAVYATICRSEGTKFRFPGTRYTWEHLCDVSDAQLLAQQQIWAAVSTQCKNQAFNCTNGDVFTWKTMWKVFGQVFDVELVSSDEKDEFEFDIVEAMKDKGKVWDQIVEDNGLCKTKLEEITNFLGLKYVLHFNFQNVSSMNKSKEYGFLGYVNSLKSIEIWTAKLREMKIIP